MRYLSVKLVLIISALHLLALQPVSPKAVRIIAGCFTVNTKRICPPEIKQLVMHDDVFILSNGRADRIQCQTHQHSQVPGHATHCIGQPGGHQQVVPPSVPGVYTNPGVGQNPVGGTPGVGTIEVP
ncbi:MAG: hypothetical protein OYH77_04680 [Pseudomonadota bacterium]|nr:hypothetical protein [Pseudomonadota bacterium]